MTEPTKPTDTDIPDNPPQVYVKSPNVIVNVQPSEFITNEKLCEVFGYKRVINVEKKLKKLKIPFIKGAGDRIITTLSAFNEYMLRHQKDTEPNKDDAETNQAL